MKKTLIAGLALGVVLTAGSAFAAYDATSNTTGAAENNRHSNYGGDGIVNSSHDLGKAAGNSGYQGSSDPKGRICIFCHHPHNAAKPGDLGTGSGGTGNTSFSYSPLWNRKTPVDYSFTAYSNGIMDKNDPGYASTARHYMQGTPQFAGVSILCMSCHDGSTAMNAYSDLNTDVEGSLSFGNGSGSVMSVDGTGGPLTSRAGLAKGGTDMSNHHPIGMLWSESAVDPEIAPANTEWLDSDGVSLGFKISDLLYGGRMECVTCHDVHNTQNETGAERFLWSSNDASKFCLTCHLK